MLLEVEDLVVEFPTPGGPLRAVEGAQLQVPAAALVGLVGESGCGKTTLARAIIGVMAKGARITRGSIRFEGRDLLGLPAAERRRLRWRDIAFVPQSSMSALDPVYRVGDQLRRLLRVRGSLAAPAARRRAVALFELVGIDPARLGNYPHQFSGGMRQRVAIALALALEPRLLIADEPVTALDVIVQRQILDALLELRQRLGIAVLLVTHDIGVVAYACDRVAVMYAGQVVEEGPAATLLGQPAHPYSMGLARAFPDLAGGAAELVQIAGDPPDLRQPPAGCRFAPRCPFALVGCGSPPPWQLRADAGVACWRQDEAASLRLAAAEAANWSRPDEG